MRGHNIGGMSRAHMGLVAGSEESAAFDCFGPMARAVFRDAPIKILCVPVLAQLRQQGLDPLDLRIDAHIAAVLRTELSIMMRGDRSAHDVALGFRPLVARRTRRA